ncbi:MAG: hypothetical protein C4525_02510 [Desulfarculus sp.]|jgi:hypothetical protein|nr:MAG: hypothetical protein C4525_02510 [Desulfarculus sp.]
MGTKVKGLRFVSQAVLIVALLTWVLAAFPAVAAQTKAGCKKVYNSNLASIDKELGPRMKYALGLVQKYTAERKKVPTIQVKKRQNLQAKINTYQAKYNTMSKERASKRAQARAAYQTCLKNAKK